MQHSNTHPFVIYRLSRNALILLSWYMSMAKDHPLYNYIQYASNQLACASTIMVAGLIMKSKLVATCGFMLLVFILFFFRNTPVCIDKGFAVSPSQSKVTSITPYIDPNGQQLNGKHTCIKTYLSPLDKHFLVGPVEGTIVDIRDYKQPDDLESVRLSILDINGLTHHYDQIVKKPGNWGYITGILIDKRVIIDKQIGDTIKKGERYGIIRFGSMMRYYIPSKYTVIANKGDKLRQGTRLTAE